MDTRSGLMRTANCGCEFPGTLCLHGIGYQPLLCRPVFRLGCRFGSGMGPSPLDQLTYPWPQLQGPLHGNPLMRDGIGGQGSRNSLSSK
jgi:hypothetical protein